MSTINNCTNVVRIPSKVVLSDNSAKKIGLKSVDEIKKGALITLPCAPEGWGNYRILAINGTQIKVVAMYSIEDIAFDQSGRIGSFDGGNLGQKYKLSDLDAKMDDIYSNLPESFKKAIVPQIISQSMYTWDNLCKWDSMTVGERYLYALDVADIIEYLDGNVTREGLYDMLFENHDYEVPGEAVWLRSATTGISEHMFCASNSGYLNSFHYYHEVGVRPTFILDLAKLSMTQS